MAKTMKDDRKAIVITQDATGNVEVRVDYEVESDGISEWRSITPTLNVGQINSAKGFLGQMVSKIKTGEW